MTKHNALTQTLLQLMPNTDSDELIPKLTNYIDELDATNTPLRFTHVQETFSDILGIQLTPDESQSILSGIMEIGYDDIIARLVVLTSPQDLNVHINELESINDTNTIEHEFLSFLTAHADVAPEEFLASAYEFTPTLFSNPISTDAIDVMLYLASFVSDEYATIVNDVLGLATTAPTLAEELSTYLPDDEIEPTVTAIQTYIDEKDAANEIVRLPHAYADFLNLIGPQMTHERTKRALMTLSFDEHYGPIFSHVLAFENDDLTEFIKIIVDAEEVMDMQTKLLAYINANQSTTPEIFQNKMHQDIKHIFNDDITDEDVDTLLYYAMFIDPEYSEILDKLLRPELYTEANN